MDDLTQNGSEEGAVVGVMADHSVDIDEQAGKAVHKQKYSTLSDAIAAAGYGGRL